MKPVDFTQSFEANENIETGGLSTNGGTYGDFTIVPGSTPYGQNFALITEGDDTTAPFTKFGGYSDEFVDGVTTGTRVYLDEDWAVGTTFQYTVAANGSDGNHQRDFAFAVIVTENGFEIGAANGATQVGLVEPLPDSIVLTEGGWFEFRHTFNNDGGVLSVDLSVVSQSGEIIHIATLSSTEDTVGGEDATVGGIRYGWFTDVSVEGGLQIDGQYLDVPNSGGGGGGGGGEPDPEPTPPVVIPGDDNASTVNGSDDSEIVYAKGGDDTVYAGGGDDSVYGGTGNDSLFSGEGDDAAFGGEGNDRVFGGEGDDVAGGGVGDDMVGGGAGNDTVYGGEGSDNVYGGEGSDQLQGGADNDQLFGAAGDDTEFGGAGSDTVYGGAGDDTVWGGAGNDELYGGAGSDEFGFIEGSGDDEIYGFDQTDGDRINLEGQTYTSATNADGDVVLTLSGGGTIVLHDVSSVDSSFFV